jgi:checkpoint serine/threonine-protein kinase
MNNEVNKTVPRESNHRKVSKNPQTGKLECVFSNLEAVYPNGVGPDKLEFSFEELRAGHRGWLDKDWSITATVVSTNSDKTEKQRTDSDATCHLNLPKQDIATLIDLSDENKPMATAPVRVPLKLDSPAAAASKRTKKEEKANRTRKIKVMQVEVRAETQTGMAWFLKSYSHLLTFLVQLNLDSPSGPSRVRKRKPEATMTLHTKEAMNEVYDIFNQPLEPLNPAGEGDEEPESEDSDDDEDDYTSAGESTGTGHISAGASEFGDETTGDFTMVSQAGDDGESNTHQTVTGSEFSDYTNTNTSGLVDAVEYDDDEDMSEVEVEAVVERAVSRDSTGQWVEAQEDDAIDDDGVTPTSPTGSNVLGDYYEEQDHGIMHSSLPYRAGKAAGRLPFMTPIVEKTESSLGAITAYADKCFSSMKTPSRQNHIGTILDVDDSDETSPLSSPFQEDLGNKENDMGKIPQPALSKMALPLKQPLEESKSHATNGGRDFSKDVRVQKGPIILDAQCNPLDESIRKTILSQLSPSLDTYVGYYNNTGTSARKGADVRKFAKSVSKKPSHESSTAGPVLEFTGTERKYTIRRELGRGAFAPVYLADSEWKEGQTGHDFGVQRCAQEVIKMEDPPSAWEFYMIRQAKRRLGVSRPSVSVVDALEMHLFDDECYLMEEYRNQGTLLDAVNLPRAESNGGTLDEQLVMFFAIEIFRTVEALHSKGIIHGDLKPDNILIRFDSASSNSNDAVWSPQYQRSGAGGWSEKGVLLIDFGRGIDMRMFRPEVQFIADWKTTEADCAEMREMRPWTFQVDYHGLAGTIHSLLFGKYMETMAERGGTLGAGATKNYRIREGLKRYWQTEIWAECFDVLLNPLMHLDGEDGRKLPIVNGLRRLRGLMEDHLEANCEKGAGLKTLARRLDTSLRERKR